MVPTARPLNSLVNAFAPVLWPDLEDEVDRREKANEKTASLEKGTLSLRDLAEIALKKQPGTQRLLLVVDQWEELYTLCRDDKRHPLLHGPVARRVADRTLKGCFHVPGRFLRAAPGISPPGRPHP